MSVALAHESRGMLERNMWCKHAGAIDGVQKPTAPCSIHKPNPDAVCEYVLYVLIVHASSGMYERASTER